jgi:hypothetical protein
MDAPQYAIFGLQERRFGIAIFKIKAVLSMLPSITLTNIVHT